jgi:hypothetical protein
MFFHTETPSTHDQRDRCAPMRFEADVGSRFTATIKLIFMDA